MNESIKVLVAQIEGEVLMCTSNVVLWQNAHDNNMHIVHKYNVIEGKLSLHLGHYIVGYNEAVEDYCSRIR